MTNDHPTSIDNLIRRLRERAADPETRTSSRPSTFTADVRSLDLGGLVAFGRSIASDLDKVVRANQEGGVDEAGLARASELERAMSTPAPSVLPGPADSEYVAGIELELGVALPPVLRRVYTEVADGGFGPGEGILPLRRVVATYRELRAEGAMPDGRTWPDGLLPLVSMDPGWDCVEAATGRVIAWDPEDLDERVSDRAWARAFREVQPSVEAWLTDWVGSRTQAEVLEIEMATLRASGAYTHIRNLQAMSPEQRASFGLEDGWEADMAATMGVPWPPPDDPAGG